MMRNSTNPTKKQKFLEAYKLAKCNISKACKAVNIHRSTFYEWQERYPKFAEKVKEIEDSLTDKIEGVLFRNAELGRQRAIEFWLTNHRKDKYSHTFRGELTGAGGGPIIHYIIEKTYEQPKEEEIEKTQE